MKKRVVSIIFIFSLLIFFMTFTIKAEETKIQGISVNQIVNKTLNPPNISDEIPKTLTISRIKFGENIYIQPEEILNKDVVAFGGDIYVSGKVNKNVVAIGGNIYINGVVGGDITCIGGRVNIDENAKVYGKVTEIAKNISVYIKDKDNILGIDRWHNIGIEIFKFIMLSVICLIIYIIIPKSETKMALVIKDNLGGIFKFGYLTLLFMPLIIAILIITIIGIAFVPLLILSLAVIYFIGFTAFMLYIGKRLTIAIMNNTNVSDILCIVIGIVIYKVITNIPFVGVLVYFLIVIPLSVGLVLRTRFGTFKPWKKLKQNYDSNSEWDKYK